MLEISKRLACFKICEIWCRNKYLLRAHDSEMMALFNLRTLAFGGAAEGVPCRAVFLKLSVLQLDLAVLHETVETESVFVRAVKHHYCVPGREGGRVCVCMCRG